MSIIAAATSRADFYTVGTTAAITTSTKIAAYAKEGITITGDSSYARFILPSAMSEGWIQFHVYFNTTIGASTTSQMIRLKSGELGQTLFQIEWDGTAGQALEYWNGSAFVEVNETTTFSTGRFKVDIQFKMDNSAGYVRVYVNDTLVHELTGDTIFTAATTLDTLEFSTPNPSGLGNGQLDFSALIIADEDTRSMVFHQGQATADGANTDWTGTYADVTELDRDDTDFIESGTAGQLETFVMDDINAALADYAVRAVVLSTRARRGASGPQNLQAVVRQSGTDFATSSLSGMTTAYANHSAVMNTNPATGVAFTQAEVNAAEFGVKSVA